MSEYRFVQWGKGVPVDYQRLGQMVSNEEYLKNKIDPAPKGVIAWKTTSAVTINPSGAYQDITGFTNLTFDVDENRLISMEFNPGLMTTDAQCQMRIRFVVDGIGIAESGGGGMGSFTGTGYFASSPAVYIPSPSLTKGTHTVSVQFIADIGVTSMVFGNAGTVSLKVRDEGVYVDPAS